MTTKIDRETVAHLARLARLALTEDELAHYVPQIGAVMAMVAVVGDIADGVPPTTHPTPLRNVLRPDVELPCLTQAEALSGAPSTVDGWIRVPPSST